ncbi:uncharacterized protein LOC128746451 [Sabethes cyaneus]|uniref:uncharacterized protein LOC128746451 n=1 Tax=Sabethes cyaneus TaxID=53552 RepID=UPI00237E3236|nr:uncharacterized protein LOC128746451 [Sabethes cyaneus]
MLLAALLFTQTTAAVVGLLNLSLTPLDCRSKSPVEVLWQATVAVASSEDFSEQAYTVFVSWEFANERSSGLLSDLINQALGSLAYNRRLPVEIINRISVPMRRPRTHNVFFVDSMPAFEEIFADMCPKLFNFAGRYLIVLLSMEVVDEQEVVRGILQRMWQNYAVNVNVLFASQISPERANMYTYFPYTSRFCEEVTKLENIHRCPLNVALYSYSAFMQLKVNSRGEITALTGVDARLLAYLATSLNFTIAPREVPHGLRFGLIYDNGTSTGAMRMVIEGEMNFTLGYFGYNYLRHKYMSLTQNYYYSELLVIVSPGESYTSFEKLLLPYSNSLWLAFIGTITASLLTIVVIGRMPLRVQNFVFGHRNRTPSLNLINSLFGGSLFKLPGRNFARFFLTLWIIYTLILRTVYQQALFNFLQQSPNRSSPNSLKQLVDNDYPIFLIPTEVYVFDHMPELKPLLRIIPAERIHHFDDAIRNGHLRGARISNYEKILYDNARLPDGRKFRILKQRLYNYALSVGLRLNSCLTKPFDDKILKLNANGLVQAWVKHYVDEKYAAVVDLPGAADERRRKLNLEQLVGAFQSLGFALGGCFVTFLGELVWGWFEKKRKTEFL